MSFSTTGSMATARDRATATLLNDGRVLVAGGFGSNAAILRSAELYDPATGQFSPAGNLRAPRAYHTATPLGDGRILIVGGLGAQGKDCPARKSTIRTPAISALPARWPRAGCIMPPRPCDSPLTALGESGL